MHEAKPSRTALRVASRRAVHQLVDRPVVFEDPLAVRILGSEAHYIHDGISDRQKIVGRPFRAFMAVRSRYAEDELAKARDKGARQYVVLGAGLDTYAYRNPHPDLRVFEVDHPATQEWKRSMLRQAGIPVPSTLSFAPVDFERQTLRAGLGQAGFRADQAAFFSWLGVVMYLTNQAFEETLRFIAALPSPSAVVFDYAVARSTLSWKERFALDKLSARVAAAGEPFRLFFEPAELIRRLHELGFPEIEDFGAPELNAHYFTGRSDGLKVRGNLGRLLRAGVAGK